MRGDGTPQCILIVIRLSFHNWLTCVRYGTSISGVRAVRGEGWRVRGEG